MNKLAKKLPNHAGVYIFRGLKREVFYIGKATSLRTRVASYFRGDLIATRGPILVGMVEAAKSVDFIETDSVLEALILEAALIKKHQPPYNTKEKDNKSFNYVVVTKEDFPRVMTMRGRELDELANSRLGHRRLSTSDFRLLTSYGPFPQGSVLREALSIVRKIFPFRDKCLPATAYRSKKAVGRWQAGNPCEQLTTDGSAVRPGDNLQLTTKCKPCFNAQIGLCPGVCAGTITRGEYAKTIRRIKLFFEGKKKTLVSGLERDMKIAAKELKFEEANRIKKTIFTLNHIQDVALLKTDFLPRTVLGKTGFRIEAYDVAHISGTNTVGVMVVIEDGEPKKSDYRKFKIKTSTNDDNASLREILERRFAHTEWPMPKLIVVDGGKAQVNTAEKALKEWGLSIPVVGVVKDEHHKPKSFMYGERSDLKSLKRSDLGVSDRAILLANSEAHRFAVSYHRVLRGNLTK